MIFGFGKGKNDKTRQEPPALQKTSTTSETPSSKPAKKSGWLGRLKQGLSRTSDKVSSGIAEVFLRRKLDEEALEGLEDILISADVGLNATTLLLEKLKKRKFEKDITAEAVQQALAEDITALLEPVAKSWQPKESLSPHVVLFCGVNGTGKTTTIGKLAAQWKSEGKKVYVAACDTFRAAAVEQLNVWAKRSGTEIVTGAEGADPASVAHTALEKARKEKADILLIDTAGRLQNKTNLMEQLAKILRVLRKLDPEAPHDIFIVLDATTGQNALSQIKTFREMADVNGIILTKLDGTAKGGIVLALATEFGLPVYAIGVGESLEDLHPFEAASFARNLVGL